MATTQAMTLTMFPAVGTTLVRHVGDRLRLEILGVGPAAALAATGWRARVRTTLGRGAIQREEVIAGGGSGDPFAGLSWHDLPLRVMADDRGWSIDLPLIETGWYRAKVFVLDPQGRQHWPEGDDISVAVHPDAARSGNTIYCAFARMFGMNRTASTTVQPERDGMVAVLDRQGWTAIPPSGTLRDLGRQLDHIVDRLGCRIIHLLPIHPTPTTHARMGRFGSPYAALDMTAVDPALAEFDRRTTPVEQFVELTQAVHGKGARLFIDIVINHTGWASRLFSEHPEWFKRNADGQFHSPGAWGNTWEDLVELDHAHPQLWVEIADTLLVWCRRGVDGFRCDAGYMVPVPAWRYITRRIRREFPDTVFLLEGLGGSWQATADLLGDGGMQWAYSELFQNVLPSALSGYLDHAVTASREHGILIHYSETHDNSRLAAHDLDSPARSRRWSLMRNHLCALTAVQGGFGFTAGVEWLANEKLEVHQARGLRWGASDHIVGELAVLNRLIADHPCFIDGAIIERLSADDAAVIVIARTSADGQDRCLCVINTDIDQPGQAQLTHEEWVTWAGSGHDLIAAGPVVVHAAAVTLTVAPGAAHCLCPTTEPLGLSGDAYRHARARAAWAYAALAALHPIASIGTIGWMHLAAMVQADPAVFLQRVSTLDRIAAASDLAAALAVAHDGGPGQVIEWSASDAQRMVPVPGDWWVLISADQPFTLSVSGDGVSAPQASVVVSGGRHVAMIAPVADSITGRDVTVRCERSGAGADRVVSGSIRRLGNTPTALRIARRDGLALLTNGRGGMARLHADLGAITSTYDCLLAANMHPTAPSDRHVFAKRLRAWIDADGYVTALTAANLSEFTADALGAHWCFLARAGDGRQVRVALDIAMVADRNVVQVRWRRIANRVGDGPELDAAERVAVTVRIDLEDRSFHAQTVRDRETDERLQRVTTLTDRQGFHFQPAPDRQVRGWVDQGFYHPGPEWCVAIPHPVEQERGLSPSGDACSPGWFELPLAPNACAMITLSAEHSDVAAAGSAPIAVASASDFPARLRQALDQFLVRRDDGLTVIAGYPWFLDWGRDTFIACRGLLAAGRISAVRAILLTFARFAEHGTLPNLLNGDRAENRDTSDAPLWFIVVAAELAEREPGTWQLPVSEISSLQTQSARMPQTLLTVCENLARGYIAGTPNGIRVDPLTGLVWSPPHFTWMDTNYPAATPRQGYPIEIQALWAYACRTLAACGCTGFAELTTQISSQVKRYWLPDHGWLADVLIAQPGQSAVDAIPDTALRPNQLFAVTLGLISGARAQAVVAACARHLVIPGAIRSLAPLPVQPPLVILGRDGSPLVNPQQPYQGHYRGDEDTRRKPAYHNGTAWLWPYPSFAEALVMAWNRHPRALSAARAYLCAQTAWLDDGCIGQLPEIADGDAPHAGKGCDAQAWSVSELLRVWLIVDQQPPVHPES